MSSRAFGRELSVARRAVRDAGQLLREMRLGEVAAREKEDGTLVTEADLAVEERVRSYLRRAFPRDALLAEEAGSTGGSSGRRWVLDPLDGTTNYSRGLPFFAVSLALCDEAGAVLGLVYLPALRELFTAVRGEGAALNSSPIRVSAVAPLRQAMLNVYFDRRERLGEGLEVLTLLARACEGRVKILGSTASLLCYTACGRLDAFARTTTRLWDFAAGALILSEAGGSITDFTGAPLAASGQSLLASNGRLHPELLELLAGREAKV